MLYRVVLTATLTAVLSATPVRGQAKASAAAPPADLSRVLESTTRTVAPTVVEIFAVSYTAGEPVVRWSADLVTTQRASGSGVIVDPAGYIVTNAHVVRGARRLRVEVPVPATGQSILATRSRIVTGELVGIDIETDLAVIKIDEGSLPALAFGDSDGLRAGQLVLAFGSPLGLHNSVSLGVVGSPARQLEPESPMIYVQTDAPINPGSSGGPLVDTRGRLVGINTLIATRGGGHEGIGFAAPSNIVRRVYEEIRTHGRVRRGDIGVRAQTITPTLAAGLGLARESGVVLGDVLPGSPADHAGLRAGDVVLALDGKAMENARQLQVNLYRHFAGDRVSLEVSRDGQTLNVPVPVGERPDGFNAASLAPDPREHLIPRLGILAIPLDPQIAKRLPAVRVSTGVIVASIVPGVINPREGGLVPGDVIHAVNRKQVGDLDGLRGMLDQLSPGDPVVLQIERRGELMYVAFTLE